jgi:hypothetical protein
MSILTIVQTTASTVAGTALKSAGGAVGGVALSRAFGRDEYGGRAFMTGLAGAVFGPALADGALPVAKAAFAGVRYGGLPREGVRAAMAQAYEQAAARAFTSGALGVGGICAGLAIAKASPGPDELGHGALFGMVLGGVLAPATHSILRAFLGDLESFAITAVVGAMLVVCAKASHPRRY